MTQTVSATDLAKRFGRWIVRAIREQVAVHRHGHESVYPISADKSHRLKRKALGAGDIPDNVAASIERAEYGR